MKRRLNVRSAAAIAAALAASLLVPSPAVAQSSPRAGWTQVSTTGPSARSGASLVYDASRGRTVLFGGDTGSGNYQSDTWEFDGAGWHAVTASGPQGRNLAPMAFDSRRHVTVLFGGYGIPGYLTDTWEYDGTSWTRNFTAHTPPARDWAAMTYDSRRHVVVLFGGLGGGGSLLNDTWEYDGNDWTQVVTADAPSARRGMSLAFDPVRGRTVLFGGDTGVPMNDTWEYDGTDWTQVSLAAAPPQRQWAATAFDSALGGMVVFGGYEGGAPLNDTWLYDGSSWQQISSSSMPSGRFWTSAAFDSGRSSLVLFGGAQDTGDRFVFGDTWSLAGANTLPVNWSQAAASAAPQSRVWPAMDFDSARGVTVLFGGSVGGPGAFSDTWEWDGFAWTQRSTSGGPPALAGAAMAYDSIRHVSVLFGGSDSSGAVSAATWEWNGATWTQRSPATSPPARLFASMAYDSSRGRIVLFGGSGSAGSLLGDTWEYDGTTWTRVSTPSAPSARYGAAAAFDSGRGRTVLFGGSDANGRQADTWEWDGSAWNRIATAGGPYARFWASMVYDPVRRRTVLFAGDHIQPFALGPTNDTWDWDGSTWARDWTASAPPIRAGMGMAYDTQRDRAVVFGGWNAAVSPNVFYGDTWELASGTVTPAGTSAITIRPASVEFGSVQVGGTSQVFSVAIASSGTGPAVFTTSTSGDFGISSTDCPAAPNPLAAGSSCVVLLTFSPSTPGDRFGSLDVAGNMAAGSSSGALHGTGVQEDFTISANPTIVTMTQGGSSPTTTISTTAIGVGGTVALSVQSNDPNVAGSVTPASIPAGSAATLSVAAGPSAQPGFYGLLVVGTEGAITHAVNVTLQLLPTPDFTIAATPSTVSIAQGDSTLVTVQTTQIGAGNTVNLSASPTPAGPTVTFASPLINAGDSTTLTVTAPFGSAAGSYAITVTGTEGSNVHSTTIALTVSVKGIVNGGFETDDFTGWSSSGITFIVPAPHTGSYAGQVGSTSPSGASTMFQTFTTPQTGGKLTFWYRSVCTGKVKNDWFTVTLHDGVTNVTQTVLPPTCVKNGGWTKVSVNLSAHAGHYVTLTFSNHDDGAPSTPSYALVDDVSLS